MGRWPGAVRVVILLTGALLLAGGCHTSSATPAAQRGRCAPDDLACFLEGLEITENGQPIELVDLPVDALPAGVDGGLPGAPGAAPQITSIPPGFTLSGEPQSLDLSFEDPTANRPAFFFTMRWSSGPPNVQCFGPCCPGGCRVIRRIRDLVVRGTAHYKAAGRNDASQGGGDAAVHAGGGPNNPLVIILFVFPVAAMQPGVDPVDAVKAGQHGMLLVGDPVQIPVQVNIAPGPPGTGQSDDAGCSCPGGCHDPGSVDPGGGCTCASECKNVAPGLPCPPGADGTAGACCNGGSCCIPDGGACTGAGCCDQVNGCNGNGVCGPGGSNSNDSGTPPCMSLLDCPVTPAGDGQFCCSGVCTPDQSMCTTSWTPMCTACTTDKDCRCSGTFCDSCTGNLQSCRSDCK